jgi:alcohol dehydrogenase (cytochrome c)
VKSIDANGSLRRDPGKDPIVAGSIVSPTAGGTVNWEPPAFSPETGYVYVAGAQRHLDLLSHRSRPARLDGARRQGRVNVGNGGNFLTAIDYRTGKIGWRHRYPGQWRGRRRRRARDRRASSSSPATPAATSSRTTPSPGAPLWHSHIGGVTERAADLPDRRPPVLLVATGRHAVRVRAVLIVLS